MAPPPGLLVSFGPARPPLSGPDPKYRHYSEGSELKRKEAQEEEKDDASGSSLLSLHLLLLPPPTPTPPLPPQLALGYTEQGEVQAKSEELHDTERRSETGCTRMN